MSPCRLGTISLLFLPALGWVGFNILQPALNQLNRQAEIKAEAQGATSSRKKRGLAGAVGLGAALSMAAAQQAEAATELAQLAASDNRWVLGCSVWDLERKSSYMIRVLVFVGASCPGSCAPIDLCILPLAQCLAAHYMCLYSVVILLV